ncbi:putative lipase gdsl [Diplodia seriata]|uniref:Putative lipase gdsl n=1 Tax=Diplodia seriata TaxID=420778 RepID=A0A0G2HD23_9PEZI|nr:putative lipase gdsl [Diplodia seriata]
MPSRSSIPLSPALSLEQCNDQELTGTALSGKNIVITGGASGVGAALAETFAGNGAYVNILDINESLGTAHAASLQAKGYHAQFIHCDLTSWPAQAAAFATAAAFDPSSPPTIHTVIACAGVLGTPFITASPPSSPAAPPPPDTTPYLVNAIALHYTASLATHHFSTSASPPANHHHLILLTSMLAYLDFPNAAAYTASKHAARGLFRILAPLLARRGTARVNAVAPWQGARGGTGSRVGYAG